MITDKELFLSRFSNSEDVEKKLPQGFVYETWFGMQMIATLQGNDVLISLHTDARTNQNPEGTTSSEEPVQ